MKASFDILHERRTVKVDIADFNLLRNNPTYRIAMDFQFIGYIERLDNGEYVTISKNPIPPDILEECIRVVENGYANPNPT